MASTVLPERVKRIGMIARWKPVHLGHRPVLHALCDRAEHALIGIGSANRYDLRNPFTLSETLDMLRLTMMGRSNYTLVPVEDLDDGPRWREMVLGLLGKIDLYVTENPYVAHLLQNDYQIIRPVMLIPDTERIPLDGSMVHRAMAQGDSWLEMVPETIAAYITEKQLDRRFRQEFGLQTLALETIVRRK